MISLRAALVAVIVLGASTPAYAQSGAAQAEALFRQGRDLLAAGKTAEACAAFESSQRAQAAVTTLLNIGGCREKNGQLATAWGAFVEAQRLLRDATDDSSKQLATIASTKATGLEARLSKLTIKVPADHAAGLEIKRGTEVVDPGTWNSTLPIDGGTYTITAHAAGHDDWSTTVIIANEKDSKTVDVPALAESKQAAPTPPAQPIDQPTSRPSKVPAIVVGSAGGALLAGALAFELMGRSKYDDATAAGANGDADKANSLWHEANTRRYIAEGMLGAGIAAGGVAVYLFLHTRHAESAPVAHLGNVRLMPMVSTNGIGIMGEL